MIDYALRDLCIEQGQPGAFAIEDTLAESGTRPVGDNQWGTGNGNGYGNGHTEPDGDGRGNGCTYTIGWDGYSGNVAAVTSAGNSHDLAEGDGMGDGIQLLASSSEHSPGEGRVRYYFRYEQQTSGDGDIEYHLERGHNCLAPPYGVT